MGAEIIDDFRGEYRFLSNFQASTIEYEGLLYPSVETAYQAAKTEDMVKRELFTHMSPTEAKRAGRCVTMRADWDDIKYGIMYFLVRQKFTIHPTLAKKLLATGNKLLVERNWWGDTYWGVCKGKGKNELGKILMLVRESLKESEDNMTNGQV